MKKILTLLLAGVMVFGMVACTSQEDPDAAKTTVATTTTATQKVQTTPPGLDIPNPDLPEDWTLLPLQTDWHYKLFSCPTLYGSPEEGAAYDPELDEMAAWITEKGEEWYKDETVLAEMATWEVKTAPMGDRYDGVGDGNSPIGWAGDVHGLIGYTTFELTEEQMEWVGKAELHTICMNVWYDNTFYIWINGTLVYSHDGAGAPQSSGGNDWNDSLSYVDFSEDVDIREILKEGENTIVVSLKDGWGGREFIMALEAIY